MRPGGEGKGGGGRAAPLVAHLARRNALAPDDIAEIEALLKALKQ